MGSEMCIRDSARRQVVGVLDDLPTCEELIDRVVTSAVAHLHGASASIL